MCRSFLSPWKDENGNYKFEGRFNQGVVSLNLPQIGIVAHGDMDKFWNLLDNRLELCFEALMCRHNALKGTISDVSPIHWQYGAIARLEKGETIDKLLMDGYSTISLGYIGLYEVTKLMTGKSHTQEKEFALKVLGKLREACDKWKHETGLGFGLYGSPAESLCHRFARIDLQQFGPLLLAHNHSSPSKDENPPATLKSPSKFLFFVGIKRSNSSLADVEISSSYFLSKTSSCLLASQSSVPSNLTSTFKALLSLISLISISSEVRTPSTLLRGLLCLSSVLLFRVI